jgi:hypothetical protein
LVLFAWKDLTKQQYLHFISDQSKFCGLCADKKMTQNFNEAVVLVIVSCIHTTDVLCFKKIFQVDISITSGFNGAPSAASEARATVPHS